MKLETLKRTRQKPEPGDVFVYRVRGMDFGFGRVIRTDARMEPWRDLLVIYIYNVFAPDVEPIPVLKRDKLLVPPLLLFRQSLWTKGYFQTVQRKPLETQDVLKVHCFRDEVNRCYVDEYERRLKRRTSPCALHAVGNEYAVEADVCHALGLERDEFKP